MTKVTLNRETHVYSPDLSSVTTILDPMIDKTFFTAEARERGRLVHLACEFFDQGDLDFESLDPEYCGYIQAYMAFRRHVPFDGEWIEIPRLDPSGQYVGTPDRVIVRRPRELTDIKTGVPEIWHRAQTAGYVNMFEDPMSFRRFCLYLRKDGTFKLVEHPRSDYPGDIAAFKYCLSINVLKGQIEGIKQSIQQWKDSRK